MIHHKSLTILFVLMAAAFAGCEGSRSPVPAPTPIQQPTAPPTPPATPTLRVFTEGSFHTSDVRDADGQIVQFNSANELIWTDDGTRLPGFRVEDRIYVPCGPCAGWIEVRFGTEEGERRAYLTVDYGHDNPGTLVDLELVGSTLTVTRTDVYPPGSYTLSGMVTEMTSAGAVPIEGASVYRGYGSGWQSGTTDATGFYEIRGLYDRTDIVAVIKEGYKKEEKSLTISGDTRFDIQLVRQ